MTRFGTSQVISRRIEFSVAAGIFTHGATCISRITLFAPLRACVDDEFGPFFLKFCFYVPYPANLCLNGDEYAKRQLAQLGIAFEALDNGIGWRADPAALQRNCDGIGLFSGRLLRRSIRDVSGQCSMRFPFLNSLSNGTVALRGVPSGPLPVVSSPPLELSSHGKCDQL